MYLLYRDVKFSDLAFYLQLIKLRYIVFFLRFCLQWLRRRYYGLAFYSDISCTEIDFVNLIGFYFFFILIKKVIYCSALNHTLVPINIQGVSTEQASREWRGNCAVSHPLKAICAQN